MPLHKSSLSADLWCHIHALLSLPHAAWCSSCLGGLQGDICMDNLRSTVTQGLLTANNAHWSWHLGRIIKDKQQTTGPMGKVGLSLYHMRQCLVLAASSTTSVLVLVLALECMLWLADTLFTHVTLLMNSFAVCPQQMGAVVVPWGQVQLHLTEPLYGSTAVRRIFY